MTKDWGENCPVLVVEAPIFRRDRLGEVDPDPDAETR